MRRFNDLTDFSAEEINALLVLAARLDAKPEPRALKGKVLSLLFLSPSLRTLASFQAAMVRLGGGSFVISPDMSIHGLETRYGIVMDGVAAEHIREAVPVIASYGDAIGIRAFAERKRSRLRHGGNGFPRAHQPDRHALHQYGVGHGPSLPEPGRLEDPRRVRHTGERRPVRAELGLPPESPAAGGPGVDPVHGGAARHGRTRAAPRGFELPPAMEKARDAARQRADPCARARTGRKRWKGRR